MTPWWGRVPIERGQAGRWQIGALHLWAWCRNHEWRLAVLHDDDPLTDRVEVEVPVRGGFAPPDHAEVRRFATSPDGDTLELDASLADRPMVARPETPFEVLEGDRTSVYLSTPVWVTVRSGTGKPMLEVPVYRPSDTWFGPNTRTGELCYAVRSSARLSLETLGRYPGRAITELELVNEGPGPLPVQRIKVPMPSLPLLRGQGHLWTPRVRVVRRRDESDAEVELTDVVPDAAGEVEHVAAPRASQSSNVLARALGALLS